MQLNTPEELAAYASQRLDKFIKNYIEPSNRQFQEMMRAKYDTDPIFRRFSDRAHLVMWKWLDLHGFRKSKVIRGTPTFHYMPEPDYFRENPFHAALAMRAWAATSLYWWMFLLEADKRPTPKLWKRFKNAGPFKAFSPEMEGLC